MLNINDFKTFYNTHETFVRKSLYFIIKNENKVDDIVQEVFVKVWKNSKGFKNRSNIKTWLYRVTVNCGYDYLRKERKHEEGSSQIENQSEIKEKHNNSVENRQLIKNGISLLDEKMKSVFVLYYISQIPQDEISKALNLPIGTVKSRLHKSRTIVSEYLKKQGVSYGQ